MKDSIQILHRKSFDKTLKMSVDKLIIEDDFSVKEVSRELSIHVNSHYRWIKEVKNIWR